MFSHARVMVIGVGSDLKVGRKGHFFSFFRRLGMLCPSTCL